MGRVHWRFRIAGFAFALAVVLVAPASLRSEEAAYRVIRPEEEAHRLLPKTCRVCHKEDDLKFFVVASPSDAGLKLAQERLFLSLTAEGRMVRRNPHSQIVCMFCHLSQPEQGQSPAGMEFRSPDGSTATRSEIERLCRLCHPDGAEGHPAVTGARHASADYVRAGLTKEGETPSCPSCHEMHAAEAGPSLVTRAFQDFAKNSVFFQPHGRVTGCVACHPPDMDPKGEAVFLSPDPLGRCQRCHPEGHGAVHPVKVASSDKTYPMEFLKFPVASDGTMTCSTCHDEPCAPLPEGKRENRGHLRGGPYIPPTDFCYRCHPKAGKHGLNPHAQVDAQGNVLSTACVFCHRKAGSEGGGAAASVSSLAYVHTSNELCMGCHDVKPHPTVNHSVEMPPERVDRLRAYEKRHAVRLPLEDEGRIVCVTCHNPHAKGVLTGQAALGAGEEHLWRVPSFSELCTPCHARYD